jgi:DNA-binding transcriptional ArsR family regulator
MSSRAPAILDHLASLTDATRIRLLLLLDRHELTVSELCTITSTR